MADRVKPGMPIPRGVATWNNILGAADAYAAGRLGQPTVERPGTALTEIIRIQNSSGAQVALGQVLEISGFLLSDVEKNFLWFDGDIPDTTRPFAIAIEDIPSGAIGRAKVCGVCVALVNVTDEAHGYAAVADGEVVLQSAASGPIRILFKPTGTGEATCAVLFSTVGGGANRAAYTETLIPGRTSTVPGGPISVQPVKIDFSGEDPVLVDDGAAIYLYSWVKADSTDPQDEPGGKLYIFYETDPYGVNWFTGQDCPAGN
jgi:hypothetical protein